MEYLTFNKEYFKKHQNKLLFLLNFPLLKVLGRYLFKIDCKEKLHEIAPNYYTIYKGNNTFTTDFRTHWKYSKRLYYSFKPVWWLMHAWDWIFADKVAPQLSFGFNTLTAYPDAGSGATTVDGYAERTTAEDTWASLRDGAGTISGTSNHGIYAGRISVGASNNKFDTFSRGFFTFDTSSLDNVGTPVISATTLNLYGFAKNNSFPLSQETPLHATESTQASNNNIANSDYSNIGRVSYGSVSYTDWTLAGYNIINFNATGVSAVQTNGITKISTQLGWDLSNTAPTTSPNADIAIGCWCVDEELTTKDPYLEVTYTISVVKTFTETPVTIIDTGTNFIKVFVRTLSELLTITDRFKKFLNGLVAYWTNKFSSRSTTWSDKNSDRGTTWTSKY